MNRKTTKFNIGLDIGTGSVGWAVTDNNYNLLHAKKKNLWGVRLFNTAETAAERRSNRSARRRYRRRRNRLNWLDEIFADELFKADPGFLNRMKYTWISKKDKTRTRDEYNLFIDKGFNDKTYFDKYPTIFHLRKHLIEDTQKADIRLVYLVIHNILKYRGNFTYEHQNFDVSKMNKGLENTLLELNQSLDQFGLSLPEGVNFKKISEILLEKNWSPSHKVSDILTLVNPEKDMKQLYKQVFTLLVGNKADLTKLFDIESTDKISISFSSNTIETELSDTQEKLTDEQYSIIELANPIYSTIVLNDILNGETYLSFAQVIKYESHHEDLMQLKTLWRNDEDSAAVKKARIAYDKYLDDGKYNLDDFYKDIKKYLSTKDDTYSQTSLEKIEKRQYLLKQRTSENGVIPFQLNENELLKIIDNQSQYYPFLKENKDKILSLINFRIPYYVGPLQCKDKSDFAWMERKADGPIRPWNFDEKVDREKSSNNFIRRMTATDTYLIGEPVVPKYSLIYQKYEVLSELNNVRIKSTGEESDNGERLSVEVKQRIYNELFKKHTTVSTKRLKDWLIKESYYSAPEVHGLSDKTKFLSSLSSYRKLVPIFGSDFVDDNKNLKHLEEVIEWQTVFEDRQILKLKLKNSGLYTDEQINKLASIRYQGWGRFSNKLLTQLFIETKIGNEHQPSEHSIIDLMWQTKSNFMEIIRDDKYNFEEQIKHNNVGDADNKKPLDLVNELPGSPALKRGIWQAIVIVQELSKFMKHAPEHIFIEFTRDDKDSTITNSRYKQLEKKYKELADITRNLASELKNALYPTDDLKNLMKDKKNALSNERLMLYFSQMGKSLYSNAEIDINRLFTTDYQVDHILPQSYIKDDSLENKALVKANENQRKLDDLLLPNDVIVNNTNRWQYLKEAGLMGPKKFANLTRTQVTERQQEGFINRQLVQTSQMVKNVANILDSIYPDTQIIETRAGLGMGFRDAFSHLNKETYHYEHPEFVKNRNVNDFHHAQDAYISTIVGTYQLKKYPRDNMRLAFDAYSKFFEDLKKEARKKDGKVPLYSRNGFIIGSMFNGKTQVNKQNGEIIWDQKIKDNISKTFKFKQYNITKQTHIYDGALYNATIQAPDDKKKLIPLKKGVDPYIYGGYTSDKPSYSTLVNIDDKKKLVNIPVRIAHEIDAGRINKLQWISDNTKHKKEIEILINKVPIGQIVESSDKGLVSLPSGTEMINNKQLVMSYGESALLSLLEHSTLDNYRFILGCYDDNFIKNIYMNILSKMENFYPGYQSEFKRFTENINAMDQVPEEKQVSVIEQILNLLHANSTNAKLKFGNIKNQAFGRKMNGYEFSNSDFIYQSPTGLYESKIHID
ncbi:type II CRISPR RNA-guided endonuclease Cas9 [Companilactobacillus jidongensis]|uniref:type II CRISPR RNA-guided endonuclease Cas9 n=1 Tax=Companilactobacillus jidongensis TaxID=2486006 RepID=UPI000F7B2296|nr:type II CRISPR RNA-guided endonuclease Cas9 [Companilactobacillus jidongensis]